VLLAYFPIIVLESFSRLMIMSLRTLPLARTAVTDAKPTIIVME
jgi:hypothetical protein